MAMVVAEASPATLVEGENGVGERVGEGVGERMREGVGEAVGEMERVGEGFVEDVREETLQVDLGNLLAFDPRQLTTQHFQTPEAADRYCMEMGRAVMQVLTARLFQLPSTQEKVGRLVELPPPSTPLPREKPLPRARPPTKWEKFAQSKGIIKRKRSKLEWDEGANEWRRRHGFKRVRDEREELVIEAKPGDVPGEDPFSAKKSAKKARVVKQEKNQLQNLKEAAKKGGRASLPSTVQMAATSLPIFGTRDPPKKIGKEQIGQAASIASTATASVGKFDKKKPGEKPLKNIGKHRKFLPVVGRNGVAGKEQKQMQSVLSKVLAKNDHDILDITKAVSVYKVGEETKQAERNRTEGKPRAGKRKAPTSNGAAKGGKRQNKGKR